MCSRRAEMVRQEYGCGEFKSHLRKGAKDVAPGGLAAPGMVASRKVTP